MDDNLILIKPSEEYIMKFVISGKNLPKQMSFFMGIPG